MVTDTGHDNPYETPETENVVVDRPKTGRSASAWWFSVVLLNLPIPVMFGISATSGFGRIGMVFGVVIVAFIGWLICGKAPQLMTDLSKGAVLTALSQCYPVLQMMVGALALGVCGQMTGSSAPNLTGVFPVTAATLLTGCGLILPSLIVGVTCCTLFRFFSSK